LIGGTFEDGSWSLYAVPDPLDVTPQGHDPSQPVHGGFYYISGDVLIWFRFWRAVRIPEPLLRIELEETNCWMFDWANSELIAIGTTNGTINYVPTKRQLIEVLGTIAVYDIGPSLKSINNSSGHMNLSYIRI
jgi:transcription factor C subunit 6